MMLLTVAICAFLLGGAAKAAPDSFTNEEAIKNTKSRKIAVIGAGAAGSSTAYYLRRFADESDISVDITVFEQSTYIGGRSTTVDLWEDPDEPVELGGSIFVKVNKVLVSAVKAFNLTTTRFESSRAKSEAPGVGVWDGRTFVFQQSDSSYYWWDIAKLILRYGWAPVRTNNLMKATVGKFLKMYEEPYFPWASLSEVAYTLGLTAVTSATGEQYLRENGISAAFANEIVQASTRVNYAQNLPLIHGLETMVCMATSGAMAVTGGNWQIFDRMVRNATTDVRLATKVSRIDREDGGSYLVKYSKHRPGSSSPALDSERFDTVILAGPYQFSDIEISPAPKTIPSEISYVELHVTLFASPYQLSPLAFNLSPGTLVPRVILTTLPPTEHPGNSQDGVGPTGYFSISTLREVYNRKLGRQEYVYKIFSPSEVNTTYISLLLGREQDRSSEIPDEKDISWLHKKRWHSYPYGYPRVTFEELKLDDNLWYTGGIESFISTMETSALMGSNIARLVANELSGTEKAKPEDSFAKADQSYQKPVYGEM